MKTKDFEKLIKMMNEIIEMKHEMENRKEEEEEGCDECKESECECPIEIALKKEYTEMMDWAFGKCFAGDTKERTIELWKILHPGVPIPRMLHSPSQDVLSNTLGMMIDVLPLYLEHKKKERK